jgi:hypothetical protein
MMMAKDAIREPDSTKFQGLMYQSTRWQGSIIHNGGKA